MGDITPAFEFQSGSTYTAAQTTNFLKNGTEATTISYWTENYG